MKIWQLIVGTLFAASISMNLSTPGLAQVEKLEPKTLDGFPSLRSEVLSMIGGATQSIRLTTDFLSDGEIVSALYIAQYRKVQVQVLLGQGKATHVLSRLGYLKAQNIPTWLRPKSFYTGYPTLIETDSKLFAIDSDLDYMARHRKFTIREATEVPLSQYLDSFLKAQSGSEAPVPKPMPLVGRPGYGKGHRSPSAYQPTFQKPIQNTGVQEVQGTSTTDGAYRYNLTKDSPPKGVATKLPKTTILQNRAIQQGKPPASTQTEATEGTPSISDSDSGQH
ncbi:MAG: hypothetical protein NT027_11435 [Proteobacteria bacterium]|nr:hypothetical protein [Pseudomonadota bacterium]